jgi:hypothetical protein
MPLIIIIIIKYISLDLRVKATFICFILICIFLYTPQYLVLFCLSVISGPSFIKCCNLAKRSPRKPKLIMKKLYLFLIFAWGVWRGVYGVGVRRGMYGVGRTAWGVQKGRRQPQAARPQGVKRRRWRASLAICP